MQAKRRPVQIDEATYNRLKAYSSATGIPISRVLADAVKDWMVTVGDARLSSLKSSSPSI